MQEINSSELETPDPIFLYCLAVPLLLTPSHMSVQTLLLRMSFQTKSLFHNKYHLPYIKSVTRV